MTLIDRVHAILFVADAPVSPIALTQALDATEGQVMQALELLQARLAEAGPIVLTEIAGGFQLATKSEYAEDLNRYLQPQKGRLSRSLLEVLAVVAYRQPITISEIEQIRGVNSEYAVRSLAERELIEELGRKNAPGRPVLYGTTDHFLHQFKLNRLTDLPELQQILPFEPGQNMPEKIN